MLKRFFGPFLLDLGAMEGEYRAFHLRDDVRQSSFYILITILSLLVMIAVDVNFYRGRPDLFLWMLLFRLSFVFISALVLIGIQRTDRVSRYDWLMMLWLALVSLFLLLYNFTRPANFMTLSYDVILPLALYIISPFKLFRIFLLTFGFSVGTLYIDLFYKSGISPAMMNMIVIAQLIVHVIGVGTAIQIQSYRRKSFRAYTQEKDAKEMVAYFANIDPLTNSMTRRQFFHIAESEFLRFSRYRRQLSLLLLDADHFKLINDTYGHYAGDLVLRGLSVVILEQKRTQDTYGRLGGEEFGLLLPETSLEQAKVVAERVQQTWAQTPCNVEGNLIYSTVSIGVAEAHAQDQSFEDILRRADRMMYKAKEAGRNRVVAE